MKKPPLLSLSLLLAAPALAQQQLPCWDPVFGTSLGLTDETISPAQPLGFTLVFGGVGYTDIQVCDNGYITLGATGGAADWDPSPVTLTADPFPRICPFWVDLEPGLPGSGDVFFRAVPATGGVPAHAVVTWLDCWEFSGTTPHTFQLVLVDGGAIRCSYDSNLTLNSYPWLVGASPGNGATQNPVSFATLPLPTNGNPTFHEAGSGAWTLPGQAIDWTPDGLGGYGIARVTGCAEVEEYGRGCVGEFASVYEWFRSTSAIDLSNTSFRMQFTGSTYTVAASTTAFVAPSTTATNLNLGNDTETVRSLSTPFPYPGGSTSTLNICSNGQVSTASNGTTAVRDFTPTPGEFLAWPNATWAVWRDFYPNPSLGGGGDVFYEEVGNLSIVTWLNVLGYSGQNLGTTPSTHQLQFDRATGDVHFVFGQLDTTSVSGWPGGEGWIVGYSPGGASLDPRSVDLSAALAAGPIATFAQELAPLTIEEPPPPILGTTPNLDVTHITPTALLGGVLFGLTRRDPGTDLTSFGMPGCVQSNDMIAVILFFPSGATAVAVPFSVPNMVGLPVQVQAAIFDPQSAQTPLGGLSSNAWELLVGS